MTDPERLDLESASDAYARERCLGKPNLVRALRESGKLKAREPNPDTLSGEKVHRGWAGVALETDRLKPAEAETLHALRKLERLVVTDWARREEVSLLGREVRLWLHHGLEPLHSGKYDVAYGTLATRRMLILDAKTLYGDVLPAHSNAQMRELVALARFNFPKCEEFTVAILAPNMATRTSIAVYDHFEAELALRRLRLSLSDAADPDAPRTPGTWCQYCPANPECLEAREHVGKTYNLAKRIETGEYILPLGERGSRFLDSVATASKVLDAMRERYKTLIASDPQSVPGWYLKPGNKVREITDVVAAHEIAANYMTLEQFLAAVEVKITPLEQQVGKKRFNELFASVLSFKQNAPSLARRGQELEQ